MNVGKHLALGAWYYATLPWRQRTMARGGAPVMICFYHRVADEHPNPWTISRRRFEKQMRWFRKHFDLVSLAEAQERIRSGQPARPAVSITFDDGYAENCDFALPLLIAERIPCTYFVASRFVLEQKPFPHDVRAGRALPVNTPEQIRRLADDGVEIGAHTRTHADLGKVTAAQVLRDEITGCRDELEAITGKAVRYFAFPFGLHRNLNAAGFHLARSAGFAGVCSAYGGYNWPGGDAFHLQRFHGDPSHLFLKNWATVDPRKAYTVAPFHYQRPAAPRVSMESAS